MKHLLLILFLIFNGSLVLAQQNKTQVKHWTLTFAGDMMAHEPIHFIDSYSDIFTNIQYLLQRNDLSFVNVETRADLDQVRFRDDSGFLDVVRRYYEER